jgi:mannose-6-phosphate isomerase
MAGNITKNLVSNQFFITNILHFDETIAKDYGLLDSFVIYLCTEGKFIIRYDDDSEPVVKGETVLLPAMINEVALIPEPEATILEIYIKTENSSGI